MINIEPGVTHEMVFNAIIADRSGSGIRSRYPRYYVWNADQLYLVGAIGVRNFGIGSYQIREFNEGVVLLLKQEGVPYLFQDIAAHSSNMDPIVYYKEFTPESTWKGMEVSREISDWARRR